MSWKIVHSRAGRPSSLAFRLTAWYFASSFLLLLLGTGLMYARLVESLNREDDSNLHEEVDVMHDLVRSRPNDEQALRQEVVYEPAAKSFAPILIRLLDKSGNTIVQTPGMAEVLPPQEFPQPPPGDNKGQPCRDVRSPKGPRYRVLSAWITGPDDTADRFQVQAALEYSAEEKLLASYRRHALMILGAGLVGCAFIGHMIARRGIRPIQRVAQTVESIGSTTLHERIDSSGLPSELLALSTTLNGMLNRLQDAFERLARFSGDIAHELRTPINVLRGEAEVALTKRRTPEQYREVLSSSLEECGRLSRIIDSLLFLARAENPQMQIRREPVDVQRELVHLYDFYEPLASEAGIVLNVSEQPASAELDRTLFQRAVSNLVENALAYTPPGGKVRIDAQRTNGTLRVEVSDTGRGIPQTAIPYVCDRFRRLDESRSKETGGSGLGLAIVKSIATLHGGRVDIVSEVGVGTRVALVFPQN
jgi:two-component system heavy metal sensor histidine kinase CusS